MHCNTDSFCITDIRRMVLYNKRRNRGKQRFLSFWSQFDLRCALVFVLLSGYVIFNLQLTSIVVDETPIQQPQSPYFHSTKVVRSSGSTPKHAPPLRVLVIAAAPRSFKHIVSLWGSLECFANQADHVSIAAPLWSQPILERFIDEAVQKIPLFSSKVTSIEAVVTVNDRYDVGLWCDALGRLENTEFDEVSLLNDSIFALRKSNELFEALSKHNVSMASLNYSRIHPKISDTYWLESVWRAFDSEGIPTFVSHSCKPASDPMFCRNAWWGQKGCIVENFERQLAWRFPPRKIVGLYNSDVPKELLTRKDSFPSWVRHAPYWNQLVQEQNFPISKVNWESMIASIDDDRLKTCTQHLDRDWLRGFDFSAAKSTI